MAEKALFSILSSDATITAQVGTNICPLNAAQNVDLPFITYTVSDYEPYMTQTAIIGGKTTITVAAYADTYKEAALLQRTVQTALAYKQGTYAGLPVKAIQPQGKSSLSELLDGSEKPIYSVNQDYIILHGER